MDNRDSRWFDRLSKPGKEKKLSAEERIEKINKAQHRKNGDALKGEKAKTVKEAGQKKIAGLLSGKKHREYRGRMR